jgi:hypothetical protein
MVPPGGGALAKDWLAAARGAARFLNQEIYPMLSKRFFAWVGVGVLSVATIPTLAAPQLARLAARRPAPAAKTTPTKAPLKATPTKAVVKTTTAVAHKTAALPVKKTATKTSIKTATKTPGRLQSIHRTHVASKTIPAAHKPTTLARKPNFAAQKPLAVAHKATPASTAKKLLH